MASTKLISPGIPNYTLKRNLQLNGKYLSNDGGDEGIRITDTGLVGIGLDDPDTQLEVMKDGDQLKLSFDDTDNTVLATDTSGELNISPSGNRVNFLGSNTYVRIKAVDAGSSKEATLALDSYGNAKSVLTFLTDGDQKGYMAFQHNATVANRYLAFRISGVDDIQMVVKGDGRVGIGPDLNSPDATLHLLATGSDTLQKWSYDANSFATLSVVDASHTTLATGESGSLILDVASVGIDTPSTLATPNAKFEVFNSNVQYSTGTVYQTSTSIIGSGTTFTVAMVGGRFVFDDGTDAGIITSFSATNILSVSTSQTVGGAGDLRAYKIYYPSVQVDTGATSTALKIGSMTISKDEIDLSTLGDLTIDAGGDITLSADGDDINFTNGTDTKIAFSLDAPGFTMRSADDQNDFATFSVAANGVTTIATVDDGGAVAHLLYDVDGYIKFTGSYLWLSPDDKTASSTNDFTFLATETLNLSSGAGGSDVHYGLKYVQTQTNLTGWDSVYLMYLDGGSGKVLAIDGNANLLLNDGRKVIFGGGSEYIAGDGTDLTLASGRDMTIAPTRHITIDAGGDIILNADGANITLQDGAGTYTPSAASDATTKAYVDANVYHFIKGGYYSTSTSKVFIPMAAAEDLREGTSLINFGEKYSFICPYDGSFEKAYARSEENCDSSVFGFHLDTGNLEVPSTTATQSVTVDMSADDTSYEFDFASAGTNTFSKGNIMAFSFDPTNAPNDVHFMIVLKFDVST